MILVHFFTESSASGTGHTTIIPILSQYCYKCCYSDYGYDRCRPDAMNEKFRKVDTHLHGMYKCITGLYKETHVQILRICTNYFVGMIKSSVYGH